MESFEETIKRTLDNCPNPEIKVRIREGRAAGLSDSYLYDLYFKELD